MGEWRFCYAPTYQLLRSKYLQSKNETGPSPLTMLIHSSLRINISAQRILVSLGNTVSRMIPPPPIHTSCIARSDNAPCRRTIREGGEGVVSAADNPVPQSIEYSLTPPWS